MTYVITAFLASAVTLIGLVIFEAPRYWELHQDRKRLAEENRRLAEDVEHYKSLAVTPKVWGPPPTTDAPTGSKPRPWDGIIAPDAAVGDPIVRIDDLRESTDWLTP